MLCPSAFRPEYKYLSDFGFSRDRTCFIANISSNNVFSNPYTLNRGTVTDCRRCSTAVEDKGVCSAAVKLARFMGVFRCNFAAKV